MIFAFIGLITVFWAWWRLTQKMPVVMLDKPELEEAPSESDPFADHPMHCKCYFHR